jgi:hypothetical protein
LEEAIARGWADLIARLDGPMHLRFFLQPAVATLLAIRAGVRDAREGKAPFLVAIARAEQRRERLRHAWGDIGRVFLLACMLDAIYQLRAHRGIYLLELLLTAVLLALLPYSLVRGPAARIARACLAKRGQKGALPDPRSTSTAQPPTCHCDTP